MESMRRLSLACLCLLMGCQSSDDDDDVRGAGGPCDGEPAAVAGITAAHNAVRSGVNTAEAPPPLGWDCELGAVAQAYAEQLARNGCSLMHSSNGFGENLFTSSRAASPDQVVDAWAGEAACYEYGVFPDRCTPLTGQCQSCGHYTQIIWRESRWLGCGLAHCGQGDVWVCNYDPPGNYLGEYPY
jgi:uncharacterized protein YkwD